MISEHLIIAPILIPFVVGALMLLYDDRQRGAKFWLSLASTAAQLLIAVELVVRAKIGGDIGDAGECGGVDRWCEFGQLGEVAADDGFDGGADGRAVDLCLFGGAECAAADAGYVQGVDDGAGAVEA